MQKLTIFSPRTAAVAAVVALGVLAAGGTVALRSHLGEAASGLAHGAARPATEIATRGESAALRFSVAPLAGGMRAGALPHPPAEMLVPALAAPPLRALSARPARMEAATDCRAHLALEALAGARMAVTVTAPCNGKARIEVMHEGITFTQELSAAGDWTGIVPALSPRASVTARLGEQALSAGPITILDHADYERVVLAWDGQTGLQIHALEFGAGYGTAGHVSAASSDEGAASGSVFRLGASHLANAAQAEIYSLPKDAAARRGTVRLVVEAEVTPYSCGRMVHGTAFQPAPDGTLGATELRLHMPECNEVGDILILKNLLRDVKIAAN
ncbi:hypothetical protein [Profundibacterium mesophilum]|uniref:Translocase n=1 Tax=Profundibacterium mesophilum KAUST100406-0324 TaxID=1037889 RepID=A0A921NTK8_9RHOB|nr:hypothetical protein [Profundibacterium mesophilum]KAF0676369.1 hypothetical protein PMES_01100 [Profundibacterium mesophilum KAUST100406-0324]